VKADLLRPVVLILWKSKQLLKPLFGKLSKPDGHRALSLFVVISILLLSLSVVVPSQVVANPAFTARTETYVNVSSTTTPFDITVTKPTGTVDGDILFCWLGFRATGSAIDSVPSGWILLGSYSGEYDRYYLYYKIAASEPASWVWSFVSSHRVRAVCSAIL
jgi:hypothetical protein